MKFPVITIKIIDSKLHLKKDVIMEMIGMFSMIMSKKEIIQRQKEATFLNFKKK